MKKTLDILLAVLLISLLVYIGSVLYYGTYDLLSLGNIERQIIAKIWVIMMLTWWFFIKED